MNWMEKHPLPKACETCRELDCYNCDTAAERWYLSREDELKVIRKSLVKAADRIMNRIEEIDRELDILLKQ